MGGRVSTKRSGTSMPPSPRPAGIGAIAREVRSFWHFARSRPGFLGGLAVVFVTLFLALGGLWIAPYPPEEALSARAILPPSSSHWMGTDISGMDIFSRVIAAPRIDLTIALVSTAVAFVAGVVLGVISGFFASGRGIWATLSSLIVRGADIFQAFPLFIFALALVGFRGPSVHNVIVALAFLNTPFFLRVTRGAVLHVRERPFVEAARCVGGSGLRLAFVHVMPNALTPALANLSPTIGFSILLTSALSFVGAGVPIPTPEWGSMIAIGAPNMMTGQWWTALFPGLALGTTILGYALVGDGLRYYLDPTRRR
jgi:peptide/nickel transport system permease protein